MSQPPRPAKRAPEPGASTRPSLVRRIPWVPTVLTLLVLVAAAFTVPSLHDAVTGGIVDETTLVLPFGYVALAPLSDVLDTLTLLTVPQHVAVLVWAIVLYAAWRVLRLYGAPAAVGRGRREAGRATLFVLTIVLTYVAAALLPRPMAAIAVTMGDVLSLDVHAHTQFSHDARPGWRVEDMRAWHQAAGFDVAYVSDHRSLDGAQRALDGNPGQAGEGTMLLPAIEVVWDGLHVNLLSAGRRYRGLTTLSLRDIDPQALALASLVPNAEPILVQTIPDDLSKMHAASGTGTAGVRAIELIDGSPRGLTQSRRDRAAIVKLADSLNLALVAGSDNHGWGRASAGWTLVRVPGWRGMPADSLAMSVEMFLRRGARQGTRVVERTVDDPGASARRVALAGPRVFWRMLTTLTIEERAAWLAWIWVIWLAWRFGGRSLAARRSTTPP